MYVVDVAATQKAFELDDEKAMADAARAAQTVFPEFAVAPAEESLTTKHYAFPGGKQVITASVYYTDESMASSEGSDSIVLGIVVGDRELASALGQESADGAVAEASYGGHTGKVRAKRFLKANGRLYLIGLECDCSRKAPVKP